MTTLNDAFKQELAQVDEGYECESESLNIPTPPCWAPWLYHVSTQENLSFRPATPRAHQPKEPGTLTTVHCHLTFEEDEESSLDRGTIHPRMEHHSPNENTMAHHLTSMEEEDVEEHFPTAYWMMMSGWKNQFQRGTYEFMKIHNMTCALTLAHTV